MSAAKAKAAALFAFVTAHAKPTDCLQESLTAAQEADNKQIAELQGLIATAGEVAAKAEVIACFICLFQYILLLAILISALCLHSGGTCCQPGSITDRVDC